MASNVRHRKHVKGPTGGSRQDLNQVALHEGDAIDSGTDYAVDTNMPGHYPDRPAQHIHYLVTAPGCKPLVTQLYFNPERGVDAARVAKLTRGPAVDGKLPDYQAAFNITLDKN